MGEREERKVGIPDPAHQPVPIHTIGIRPLLADTEKPPRARLEGAMITYTDTTVTGNCSSKSGHGSQQAAHTPTVTAAAPRGRKGDKEKDNQRGYATCPQPHS